MVIFFHRDDFSKYFVLEGIIWTSKHKKYFLCKKIML